MEAFRVGDIIAPHYSLRLFSTQGGSDLVLPTDVIVVLGVEDRGWNVTLLLHGGHVRNYAVLDPSPWEVTTVVQTSA